MPHASDQNSPAPPPAKPRSGPKKNEIIFRAAPTVKRTNSLRERVIRWASQLVLVFSVGMALCTAWALHVVLQPVQASSVFVQYVTGQINKVPAISEHLMTDAASDPQSPAP
ncbi:hypothetical protein ACSFA0_26070 [Variovorax sp. LT1P1]|uniref:hypothetical protein n=1 Tax=Variovorax sp. LT1P1 TaxID=3443730 RepID=UPI003F47BDEE